jgi:probable F420-dependent oxidoreductase
VKFGLVMFATEYAVKVTDFARMAEDRGYESVILGEHSHVPCDRRTPYPQGGVELPREFMHMEDPLICLSAMAAVTERLLLATGTCLITMRDPIMLAKEVATLDQISDGRVLFGIGTGWNKEELRNHGTDFDSLQQVFRERLAALKLLWTEREAEFHGRFVDFDPVWLWPKPVQKPWPPILLGGAGPSIVKKVVALADGWLASGRHINGAALAAKIADLQRAAADAGRARIPVTMQQATPTIEALREYKAMGVDRCILRVPPASYREVADAMDRHVRLIERFGEEA